MPAVVHLLVLVAALVCFLLAALGALVPPTRLAWGWLGAALLTADALVTALLAV